MRYIFKLRRGWKYDSDPETGKPRDDWAKYEEEKPNEAIPLDGELVLEYDNGIPRLKIGDGKRKFSELPYMSVDSFILPKPISVTIKGGEDNWIKEDVYDSNYNVVGSRYGQTVEVVNATITHRSKVDLQPSSEQLAVFHEKDLAFVTENDDGVVSVFCIGQIPQNDYTIQATVTEIVID